MTQAIEEGCERIDENEWFSSTQTPQMMPTEMKRINRIKA